MKKNKILITIWIIVIFVLLIVISFLATDYKRREELKEIYTIDVLDTSKYNKITMDDFMSLLGKDELSFVYIGKNNCDACLKQTDILSEVIDEYKIKVNYLSIVKISSYDLYERLIPLEKDFENGIGTPTLLLVKNNKIVMYKRGLTEKSDLIKLLKDNKYI